MTTHLILLSLLPLMEASDDVAYPPAVALTTPNPVVHEEEEEGPIEYPDWSGSINFGITLNEGNSENFSGALLFELIRLTEIDRATLNFYWNYGEEKTDGVKELTDRKVGGSLKYDYFLTEKLYLFVLGGAAADKLADLQLRYTLGGGLGYQFIDTETYKHAGELGLTYFNENFEEGEENDYVSALIASRLEWQVVPTTRFKQDVVVFPSLEDSDDIYIRGDNRVVMNVTESMLFQLQYLIEFDHTPADDAKQTDHTLLATLGWAF